MRSKLRDRLIAFQGIQSRLRFEGGEWLRLGRFIGNTPTLGAGPLANIILALRRGAPSNAGLCGAFAGLAASGITAAFYATNCFDGSPLFVSHLVSARGSERCRCRARAR